MLAEVDVCPEFPTQLRVEEITVYAKVGAAPAAPGVTYGPAATVPPPPP